MKKVSIILLHYKQERYVTTALDSIFEQDYPEIELIFVDDATPGLDLARIKKYCNTHNTRKIKIAWQINSKNLGTVRTTNLALKQATGDYVLLFAADDKLGNEKVISSFVKKFAELPEDVCMVSGQCVMMDKDFETALYSFVKAKDGAKFNKMSAFEQYKVFCGECFLAMGATCFKREVVLKAKLFDERYKYVEDWPAFLAVTEQGYRIFYDGKNEALLHRDGGISHTVLPGRYPKHIITYRENIVSIFLDLIAVNFKKFSKKEKERFYNVFLMNLAACVECTGDFDARRLLIFKYKNVGFFGVKKLKKMLSTINSASCMRNATTMAIFLIALEVAKRYVTRLFEGGFWDFSGSSLGFFGGAWGWLDVVSVGLIGLIVVDLVIALGIHIFGSLKKTVEIVKILVK